MKTSNHAGFNDAFQILINQKSVYTKLFTSSKLKIHLLLFCIILFSTCERLENTVNTYNSTGKIVGYLKCTETEISGNKLLGVFIISVNKDSLLSFNIPSSLADLDTSQLKSGIRFIDGDSVSFSYRIAKNDEIECFDCPPVTMQDPTFYPIENFSQVIVTNVNKIR